MADELWSAARVAKFLGYSYEHFRKEVRFWAGVPQPIDKPGRDRWRSEEWQEWAKSRSSYAKAA